MMLQHALSRFTDEVCIPANTEISTEPYVILPQYYRPRYGCEGLRGPLKGQNENYISVQVRIQVQHGFKIN